MFTGIVEEVGLLAAFRREGTGARATIETLLARGGGIGLGDSVSVEGCCLTAVRVDDRSFDADLSAETLEKTTFGAASAGRPVNLERALAAGSRLGGHLVQGHVDSVGHVVKIVSAGESRIVTFRADAALRPYVAAKGSVAVNGVSLTVNDVADADGGSPPAVDLSVMLVPFTLAHTTFGSAREGDPVNLETDVVAKYVLRSVAAVLGDKLLGGLTLERLKEL